MLRVGVLCDDTRLSAWEFRCLQEVVASGVAEIVLFVVNEGARPRRSVSERLARAWKNGLVLWRAYERLVVNRRAQSIRREPLPPPLDRVPQLRCRPVPVGKFREALDDASLHALRDAKLDVLLRFGFGILTGGVLAAARHGIWSYHHGDPTEYRGAPPGFWEIHNGSPVTGTILQRLTETLDGGIILDTAHFKTVAASYPRNLDSIFFGAAHLVAKNLRLLAKEPTRWAERKPLPDAGPIYRYPKTGAMLRFFARTMAAKIRNKTDALFKHQQWTVGVVDAPPSELARVSAGGLQPQVRWLPERSGVFVADPMILEQDDGPVLLVEEFDWSKGLGHISSAPWPPTGGNPEFAPLFKRPFHLSYPYPVRSGDRTYIAAEAAQSGWISLVELDSDGCRSERRIIEFAGIDPTLFRHDGRWWLLCTSLEGQNHALHAWHADDPLGPWQQHLGNPIKLDIRSARPAGPPFQVDGQWIRPAQDCASHYGSAIVFHRLVTLTPDEFEEERLGSLVPDSDGPYPAGMHTIAGLGSHSIVDGARWMFSAAEMKRVVASKLPFGKGRR